jgi:hypothetical protein
MKAKISTKTLAFYGIPMDYHEQHVQEVEDVGVAFNHDRIWVCINGQATLRAKVSNGKLYVEWNPPTGAEK